MLVKRDVHAGDSSAGGSGGRSLAERGRSAPSRSTRVYSSSRELAMLGLEAMGCMRVSDVVYVYEQCHLCMTLYDALRLALITLLN